MCMTTMDRTTSNKRNRVADRVRMRRALRELRALRVTNSRAIPPWSEDAKYMRSLIRALG